MKRSVDYDRRLAAARQAVSEACVVCRHFQPHADVVHGIAKADNSPVTVADWASQAVVIHRLHEALGDEVIVAEESAAALRRDDHAEHRARVLEGVRIVWPDAQEHEVLDAIDSGAEHARTNARSDIFWTLDPIDGTKGFLRGGQYCVCLAWVEAGTPVVGVLGCPNLSRDFSRPFNDPDPHGSMYFTYAGAGLYEAPADDPTAPPLRIQRLAPSGGQPIRVCESIESRHASESDAARVLASIGSPVETMRLDSQCKYAVVARGQADAFLRMASRKGYVERIWDHAPGSIIAIEAGCAVSDTRGNLLEFGHGAGLEANRGLVCAPAALHGQIVGAIRSLGLAEPSNA